MASRYIFFYLRRPNEALASHLIRIASNTPSKDILRETQYPMAHRILSVLHPVHDPFVVASLLLVSYGGAVSDVCAANLNHKNEFLDVKYAMFLHVFCWNFLSCVSFFNGNWLPVKPVYKLHLGGDTVAFLGSHLKKIL